MHIEDTITAALIMFIGKCFVLVPPEKTPLSIFKWCYCWCLCRKDNWITFRFPQSLATQKAQGTLHLFPLK